MKLAKIRHRFMAGLIDFLIVLIFVMTITLIKLPFLIDMFKVKEQVIPTKLLLDFFRWGLLCCILFIAYYSMIPLLFKGQTIGKKIFKLKIVKENGEDVDYKTMIFRECIGRIFIDFASLGVTIIATYVIMCLRNDNKGIADILVKTKVIDLYESEE